MKDDVNKILDRALEYVIPKDEVRSFQFACSSAFGMKMPIFTAEQLIHCGGETLLLFTMGGYETESDILAMFLHSFTDDGKLNVSLSYDDSEIESFSKEELFAYKEGKYNIYYCLEFPKTKPDFQMLVQEKIKALPQKKLEKVVKKRFQRGIREALMEGLKEAAESKLISKNVAKGLGEKAVGPAVDVVLGSGEAGIVTYQSRMKEKKYEQSGGVKGYSRTRANKEIATEWSKKAVGTVGGMGSAALLTSGAAMAGQVNHRS